MADSMILRESAMKFAGTAGDYLSAKVGEGWHEAAQALATTSRELMNAAWASFQMEAQTPPADIEDGLREAVGDMTSTLLELLTLFDGSDSETSRRVGGRIRRVLEKHGVEFSTG